MRLDLILLLSFFISIQAQAFPTTRHYSVATEAAQHGSDFYTHWDGEASSDYVTYQRPLEWDAKYWRAAKTYDLSVGSISSKQFLTYQRLKLHQNLTEKVQFRLHLLEERDWEQDYSQIPIELKFTLSSKWAVSAFGVPSLYKAEDDVGAAVYFAPNSEWEYRLSGVWGDFQRNQRNLDSDRWATAPVGVTVSALYLPADQPKDFWRAEVHYEPRSRRSLNHAPVTDLNYESVFLSGLHTLSNGRTLGARILYDHAFTSDHPSEQTLRRKRSLNQFEYSFIAGPHVIRPGVNLFYREARVNHEQVIYREVLPTLWFQFRTVSLGYDATVFNAQSSALAAARDSDSIDHRLNVKYDMVFSQAGQLALLFTFDLDRFGSGETWEGGAGQFRLEF